MTAEFIGHPPSLPINEFCNRIRPKPDIAALGRTNLLLVATAPTGALFEHSTAAALGRAPSTRQSSPTHRGVGSAIMIVESRCELVRLPYVAPGLSNLPDAA